MRYTSLLLVLAAMAIPRIGYSLSSGDVNVKLISGYFWLDNACTAGGPQGKVVSFRIINTKGSLIQNFKFELTGLTFVATGGVSYTSGTPSFICRTSTTVYLGDIPAGDSVTAFFFVGYNCLMYANNTNLTTDYLTLSTRASDNNSGTVNNSFNKQIYVLRNSNNNTISILATSTNTVGTLTTISVAYSISNVKPSNIIDMELSTLNTFPSGYSIVGCRITASTITNDFPVNLRNTHYSNSITSNLPSGGTVTIEWYLKITQANTGLTSSNIVPFVVSDAGSSQRWQANTTSFTGTSLPTNPLTMTKRASRINNLVGDTLMYTIVIHNSSTITDVTIDRLVDKLPRDFNFRYLETNLGVFPRLVTYSNSTSYPEFQDTNYLFFNGQKLLPSNTYSWVIPRQDSIKLIYSVQVSSIAGYGDTNFISAYVGNDAVANAFARVNVLTSLPIKLIDFKAQRAEGNIDISWIAADVKAGERFELYRIDDLSGEAVLISRHEVSETSGFIQMISEDHSEFSTAGHDMTYRLVHTDVSGRISNWTTFVLEPSKQSNIDIRVGEHVLLIQYPKVQNRTLDIVITDVTGRVVYKTKLEFVNGTAMLPIDAEAFKGMLMITVYNGAEHSSAKFVRL